MKYGILPCPKCITLASCKTKDLLRCPILYTYFFTGIKDWFETSNDSKIRRRLNRIESFFGKIITSYDITSDYEFLIRWDHERRKRKNV